MIEKINLNNILFLDIETVPEVVSYKRLIKVRRVDFPEPVFPKIAKVSPFLTVKEMFCNALILVPS